MILLTFNCPPVDVVKLYPEIDEEATERVHNNQQHLLGLNSVFSLLR